MMLALEFGGYLFGHSFFMYQFEKNAFSRACAAFFIAHVNQVHIHFIQNNQQLDCTPYFQLLIKVERFLQGELTSLDNLLAAQQKAFDWRESLILEDNIALRIFDFCMNMLSHSADCILDADINEFNLLFSQLNELNAEMKHLGADIQALASYQQELLAELDSLLVNKNKAPVGQAYKHFITQNDTSFFGMQP